MLALDFSGRAPEAMAPLGARTTYTYDEANQLTSEDAAGTLTTYTYDNNGNTLTINAAGQRTTTAWSDEDDLLTAQPPSGGTVTMTYDGDHVRRKRQDASVTRKYVWDQEQLLLETGSGNATVIRYTLAPFGYGDLVSKRQSNTTHFCHYDALGSTRALTIGNQAVSDTYLYQAFGETIASTGGAVNSFRYVGKLGYFRETAIDGYLLRRRYYRPGVGRFLSRDPIEPWDYAYCGNRPTVAVDPSGWSWQFPEWPPPPIGWFPHLPPSGLPTKGVFVCSHWFLGTAAKCLYYGAIFPGLPGAMPIGRSIRTGYPRVDHRWIVIDGKGHQVVGGEDDHLKRRLYREIACFEVPQPGADCMRRLNMERVKASWGHRPYLPHGLCQDSVEYVISMCRQQIHHAPPAWSSRPMPGCDVSLPGKRPTFIPW